MSNESKHNIKIENTNMLLKSVVKIENKKNKDKSKDHVKNKETLIKSLIEKEAEEIFHMIEDGNAEYELQTLLDAVIKKRDSSYILLSATCAKGITREQFLSCGKAIVDLSDAGAVVWFYKFCNIGKMRGNNFNISKEYIQYIKDQDNKVLMEEIIKDIKAREKTSRRFKNYNIPYGCGLFYGAKDMLREMHEHLYGHLYLK